MISSNILPNILPKKIYIAFERKIAQKKNAAHHLIKIYTTTIGRLGGLILRVS
jgi:hypothetical protein